MRLKLIKPVAIGGHPGLRVGDIFESNDRDLLEWCVEVAERPTPVAEVVTREPVVEHRDPKRLKKTLP